MFRLITSSNSANVPDDLEALANAARSSCPIPDFKAHTTDSNGLDVVRLKRSTSTFLTGIGSFLSGTQSHAARLDTVEDRVVPVSVEPCDFGIRVETQNVAVRDMYVLALLCNPRHFGRYRPAHLGLDHDYVPVGRDQLDHFDSEVRNGTRKRAPNNIDAATDRHDALAAVWGISSQCAIRAKTEHAIDAVGIVGGEELLGGRYVVFRASFHLCAPLGSLLLGILCPSIQTTG